MRLRHMLVFVWCVTAVAGANDDPDVVIRRATEKVVASMQRIPSYTCVETVNRFVYRPARAFPRACAALPTASRDPATNPDLHLISMDRLHLDVAIADRREIFSWAGATRFEDAGLGRLVGNGPLLTGAFVGYLSVVFKGDVKSFRFERHLLAERRALMEYSFDVPKADSHYLISNGRSSVPAAYRGTVQLDPETDEVVLMTVETNEVSASTRSCQTSSTVDFDTVKIGGEQLRLATRVFQRFVGFNGEVMENSTIVGNCREYRGESTVRFEAPPVRLPPITEPRAPAAVVPPGLRFTLELTTPIDAETAAAGDLFAGKLVTALRDRSGRVLAPEGARLHGRLLRVETVFQPAAEVLLVLKPEVLEIDGSQTKLAAVLDSKGDRKGLEILLPLRGEKDAGVFRFAGTEVVLKEGFRSEWRTVSGRH